MKRSRLKVNAIRDLRSITGISKKQLSKEVNISEDTIKKAEVGGLINGSTILALAKYFKVDPTTILEDRTVDESESKWREGFKLYLSAVRQKVRRVDFLGLAKIQNLNPLDINAIYVTPQFSDREARPESFDERSTELKDVTPENMLATGLRTVLLAGPGFGKSMLVKWLSYQLAAEKSNPWRKAFNDAIPIPMILREMKLDPSVDTWDKLRSRLVYSLDILSYITRDQFEVALLRGNIWILIDGLDEVGIETRKSLHKAIWHGMKLYPKVRWLFTSRIQGYEVAPLHNTATEIQFLDWVATLREHIPYGLERPIVSPEDEALRPQVFYLSPFDNERIRQFAHNWYLQREETVKRAKERADELWQAIVASTEILILARVANLLALMSLVHHNYAILPKGRVELYERIVDSYLDTIDRSRGINARYTADELKLCLSYLAYQMIKSRDENPKVKGTIASIVIPHRLLHQYLGEAIGLYCPVGMQDTEPDKEQLLIDWYLERSGLLVEQGNGNYTFIHLTFAEYFAACHIIDGQIDEMLKAKVLLRYWHETIRFLFQLAWKKRNRKHHQEIRQAVFGKVWEGAGKMEKLPDDCKFFLADLISDPYNGFELPSDQGMTLAELVRQEIYSIQLSDDQVSYLDHIANSLDIRILCLSYTSFNDSGLPALANFPNLHTVNLRGTKITDAGLPALANIPNLHTLNLGITKITDAGLPALANIPNLHTLHLRGTKITDAGILALANIQKLEILHLHLRGTNISDNVLPILAKIPLLHTLYLSGNNITDVGRKKLIALKPGLRIL